MRDPEWPGLYSEGKHVSVFRCLDSTFCKIQNCWSCMSGSTTLVCKPSFNIWHFAKSKHFDGPQHHECFSKIHTTWLRGKASKNIIFVIVSYLWTETLSFAYSHRGRWVTTFLNMWSTPLCWWLTMALIYRGNMLHQIQSGSSTLAGVSKVFKQHVEVL